ncbi:MAG: chromosomal replication initiator protein DnaA [Candidatus Omnitrophota bacterium]
MEQTVDKLWHSIIQELEKNLNPRSVETWIKPLRPLEIKDDLLIIEAPNKFFKDWLEEHYKEEILKNARLSGTVASVSFVVGKSEKVVTETPRAPKKERAVSVSSTVDTYLNSRYSFDNFVIGPSNRFAHAAALAVAESPANAYNPLFIYGGVGLGKTHLMQAIGQYLLKNNSQAKTLYISSEKFTNQLISSIQNRSTLNFRNSYRTVDVLLIDDIHFIAGKESTQEEFFHTFNALYDSRKQIVISSDRPPKEIPGLEERLVSRFEWGLVTDVQPPDLETRIAILKKKAEKEVVEVPNDVAFFIADRIKANIRELEGALIRVVAYALLIGKKINVDLVKEVLKETLLQEEEKRITIEAIQKKVAEYFDIRLSDMTTKRRTQAIAYPRQIAMYLTRNLTDFSLPKIGEAFGGRDHTTVLHACEKLQQLLKTNTNTKNLLNHLTAKIKGT